MNWPAVAAMAAAVATVVGVVAQLVRSLPVGRRGRLRRRREDYDLLAMLPPDGPAYTILQQRIDESVRRLGRQVGAPSYWYAAVTGAALDALPGDVLDESADGPRRDELPVPPLHPATSIAATADTAATQPRPDSLPPIRRSLRPHDQSRPAHQTPAHTITLAQTDPVTPATRCGTPATGALRDAGRPAICAVTGVGFRRSFAEDRSVGEVFIARSGGRRTSAISYVNRD